MTVFHGHAGDDNLTGTSGDDVFRLMQGGNDTANGGAGDDTFLMGATLNAGDRIDGGADTDTVVLRGDYSAGVTFDAQTITNIEVLRLTGAFDYNLTLNDGNVAAGQTLKVTAGLDSSHALTFDGSAETDGHFLIYGGAGDDSITGGAKADAIHLGRGGIDTVHAGGGNDRIDLGGSFTAADNIDGGTGNDTVRLEGMGDDAIAFSATTMTNVENLVLGGGHSYTLATADETVAAGQVLTINGVDLGGSDLLSFNGSPETDGSFVFNMGGGLNPGDVIHGGSGDDVLRLDLGNRDYGSGFTFNSNTIQSVETIVLGDNDNYNLTLNDGNVGAGDTLTVDATGFGNVLTWNGSAETDGNYLFKFASAYNFNNQITGGAGNDTIEFNGNLTGIELSNLNSIETIRFDPGNHTYSAEFGPFGNPGMMTIDGSNLLSGDSVTFDGSSVGVGSGAFTFLGGSGSNTFFGSQNADTFNLSNGGTNSLTGSGGQDTFICGSGTDVFHYAAAAESTSTTHDIFTGFSASNDSFDMPFALSGGYAGAGSANENLGSLDADLAAATASVLPSHGAVQITFVGSDFAGETFIVVDANGTTGYQAGADYVFEVTGLTGTVSAANFV